MARVARHRVAADEFVCRRRLVLVRGGDYAHAGEKETIDVAFGAVPKDPGQSMTERRKEAGWV